MGASPREYLKHAITALVRKARFEYRLTTWLYITRWRRLRAFLRRHFDLVRRTAFIGIGAALGIAVDRFGGSSFSPAVLSGYLIAVGAMAGATIAIVFTISTLLLQNASDIYSSDYLEEYVHDWREKAVYFTVILITLGLFGGGLLAGSVSTISETLASLLVVGSLVLVGTTFALIDWQYKLVRQKIAPGSAIAFLERAGTRFLQGLEKDARRMASIMQGKNGAIDRNLALAATYNRFLQPFISTLDRQLANLVEITIKLSDRQEMATTKRGLTAVYRILERFLEARSTSSLVLHSPIAFLALESDSHAFLTRNCERLNTASEKFLRDNRDELTVHVMEIYKALVIKAKDMVFVGGRKDNPIVDLFVAFLNFSIERGERTQNLEVVYQGARILGDLSVMAAEKGLHLTLNGLQENILNTALYGLAQKHTIVVDRCTSAFLRILGAVFNNVRMARQNSVSTALRNIATISNYHFKLASAGLTDGGFAGSMSLTKPYDDFPELLRQIMNGYSSLTEEGLRDRYRADLVELFHELNASLRRLSEELKSCDNLLVDSISRLLYDVNSLIIALIRDASFVNEARELRNRLTWNIHLPYWFAHHAQSIDGGSGPFRSMVECVGMTGILAAEELGEASAVSECVDCLGAITEQCLEKGTIRSGFDEPRVLEKACYLGIIALKRGWRDVVTNVGVKIYEYEPKFRAKYIRSLPAGIDPASHNVMGLPHSDQLQQELWRLRDNLERNRWRTPSVREDAEAMMYGVIEARDIDQFIFEVWGIWQADTPFDEEMKLGLARRRLLGILQIALKSKQSPRN